MGFIALVPIPNARGRHRAAPFGLGPWDNARVASQQSSTLCPGPRHCRRQDDNDLPETHQQEGGDIDEARFGRLFDPSCPRHSLRSLPFGPTRGGPWMQWLPPEMVEAGQHDAVNGVALTVRNSHLINPRLPLQGRATHACRERYLAKEWFGSNRVGQERLQLPVATTTETNPKKNDNDDCMRFTRQTTQENQAVTPRATATHQPRKNHC